MNFTNLDPCDRPAHAHAVTAEVSPNPATVRPLDGTPHPITFPVVRAVRVGTDVLDFRPTWAAFAAWLAIPIPLAFFAFAVVIRFIHVRWADEAVTAEIVIKLAMLLVIVLVVPGMCLVGVGTATHRLRIDRVTRVASRFSLIESGPSWPLVGLLGVQCLYERRSVGKGGVSHQYQINLLWKGPPGVGLNIWKTSNAEAARAMSGAIAEFVGVPLLDQIDATRAAYERDRGERDSRQPGRVENPHSSESVTSPERDGVRVRGTTL